MITGKVKPPPFASPACPPLPIGMTLYKRPPCLYGNQTTNRSAPAVFWIRSSARSPAYAANVSAYFFSVLGLSHRAVPAVITERLLIPKDVAANWEHKSCLFQSSAPSLESLLRFGSATKRPRQSVSESVVVSGLCGRGKGRNSLHDLSRTVSHLLAMRAAIEARLSTSEFAIVAEDDVLFPFDVDFDALARSAPTDFGLLRLTSFHEVLLLVH